MQGSGEVAPFPMLPPGANSSVYLLPNGTYLVDGTADAVGGQSAATLEAQGNAVLNLIGQIQTAQAGLQLRAADAANGWPMPGGGGSGGGGGYTNQMVSIPLNTNMLWLGIQSVSNGLARLDLYVPTNCIYTNSEVFAIWCTTNLLAGWQVVEEVWLPAPRPQTNPVVVPFTVATFGAPNLFVRAEDWTGVVSDGLPDWWKFFWLNSLTESATNQDCQGNSLLYDYTNNLAPAEPPAFTLLLTNQMVLSGTTAELVVAVSGAGPFTNEWLLNGGPVVSNLITTVAGGGQNDSENGGAATLAALNSPHGVAMDCAGNLFLADYYNNVIRRVDTNGMITTVAGNSANGYSYAGDGGAATNASLYLPSGVAVDGSGNLFIADSYNNVIRKVGTNGIITTVAGNHGLAPGYTGDGRIATDASLNDPSGVAVDGAGNLLIADTGNQVIRKVGTNGIIRTVAGNNGLAPGYTGDGGAATNASLSYPAGVAVDGAGNLFIADTDDQVIRRVGANGMITTVAGNNGLGAGYSGDGGAATNASLNYPSGVALDGAGNLFIADTGDQVIRKVGTNGMIMTVAGTNSLGAGYAGDGGAATLASLNLPWGVVVDGAGNFYIADAGNNVIREVTFVNFTSQTNQTFTLTIPDLQTNQAGNYQVIIGNACGGVASPVVTLVAGEKPAIIQEPVSQFLILGDDAVFKVAATGVAAPAYQWYLNSAALAGATNAVLNLMNVATNNLGAYQVMVTNTYGSVTSSVANLTSVQVYAGSDLVMSNATPFVQTSSLQLQGVVFDSSGNPPAALVFPLGALCPPRPMPPSPLLTPT